MGLPYNKTVEEQLLMMLWVSGNENMIERLDLQDFQDSHCRFFFNEFRLMVREGHPTGDISAVTHWFRDIECERRWREQHFEGTAVESLAIWLGHVSDRFSSSSNLEYYFRLVRGERIRRAAMLISAQLMEMAETHSRKPWRIYLALETKLNQLWELVHETFDKELEQDRLNQD